VWLDSAAPCEIVAFSAWYSDSVVGGATSISSQSRLGPPLAVEPVARILTLPAGTDAVTVLVCQVSQLPVPANDSALLTTVPLTAMFIGRSTVVPLANRSPIVAVPAV